MSASTYNIRLATTEALLAKGWLIYSYRIPVPSLPVYADHATRSPKQDGGVALRGFVSTTMLFENLDGFQIRKLKELVNDSLSSADGLMYATIDREWGGGDGWIDVKGVPSLSPVAPQGGTRAMLFDSVTLTINNLTVVNDPAVL